MIVRRNCDAARVCVMTDVSAAVMVARFKPSINSNPPAVFLLQWRCTIPTAAACRSSRLFSGFSLSPSSATKHAALQQFVGVFFSFFFLNVLQSQVWLDHLALLQFHSATFINSLLRPNVVGRNSSVRQRQPLILCKFVPTKKKNKKTTAQCLQSCSFAAVSIYLSVHL